MRVDVIPQWPLLLEDGSALLTESLSTYIELGNPYGEWVFMPSDLFDLTYRVARELGIVEESTFTSNGTQTTGIDTYRDEVSDWYNGGTLWLVKDAGGAGAAPEKEFAIIQDWNAATGTFTLRNTLSVATGIGDKYAIANRRYPLNVLIQAINSALMDLGRVPYTDTTSITLTSVTEYSLPIGASEDLREVYYQTLQDANDNQWQLLHNWEVETTATGAGETLILPLPLSSGYKLKLVYMAVHPELHDYDDPLSELIPVERIVYPAVVSVMRWYRKRVRGRAPELDGEIEKYESMAKDVVVKRPIKIPRKTGRINLVPDNRSTWTRYPGDRTPR